MHPLIFNKSQRGELQEQCSVAHDLIDRELQKVAERQNSGRINGKTKHKGRWVVSE